MTTRPKAFDIGQSSVQPSTDVKDKSTISQKFTGSSALDDQKAKNDQTTAGHIEKDPQTTSEHSSKDSQTTPGHSSKNSQTTPIPSTKTPDSQTQVHDKKSTILHDVSGKTEATPAYDPTSIGPWKLVTASVDEGKMAVAGKHFNRLHRHRTTTAAPSTDLETQLVSCV